MYIKYLPDSVTLVLYIVDKDELNSGRESKASHGQ